MNRLEIATQVKAMLYLNDAQINNSISAATLNKFINLSYVRLWNRIRSQVSKDASCDFVDTTWPQSAATMDVPPSLRDSTILGVYRRNDNGTTSTRIPVQYQAPQVWAWPLADGPASGPINIRIYFKMGAEPLVDDDSIPAMLSPEHHELIAFETAIYILKLRNRDVPPVWITDRDDLEFYATKDLMTKPLRNEARIRPNDLSHIIWLG